MSSFIRNLRYGVRLSLRSPGFTLLAVLTLGLGIGVNTALLSAIQAVFVSPLPYPDAERLVFLTASFPGNRHGGDNFSFLDFQDLRESARSFEAIAAHQDWVPVTLTGEEEPERLVANFVTDAYFDVLEGRAAVGRTFAPEENRAPDARPVAVFGDGGLALLLSALGVYGALAQRVAARTREIGLRMALGAGRSSIVRMVLRDGMALVSAGLVVGLVAALALSRALASLLFGVSPTDPSSYALVAILLLAIAALACAAPARRATRVSPMEALRAER